ncbi:MAG: peptidase M50 [Candidatus Saganbacteria bacterium]|uniref:Peptidase M50 n=1 Tax=Candidatus Saganbacteria bacterium TaxID=2575572 RepID=A0A833NWT7_UNCSA|nr:MAG: peptidase M50 [Candidatus Saganbacteria bacterium]
MEFIILIAVVLFSISMHEYAHAKVADVLGDPTPRLAGRLTLNPLAHLDPIGFLMLVLIKIGWAKPVPINPYNFKNPSQGMMLVGLGGPVSNFILAWILAIIFKTVPINNYLWATVLQSAIFINLALMVFNLLPIPPLDGSRIYTQYLPVEWQYNLEKYGFFILIGIIMFPPTQEILFFVINFFYRLLLGG